MLKYEQIKVKHIEALMLNTFFYSSVYFLLVSSSHWENYRHPSNLGSSFLLLILFWLLWIPRYTQIQVQRMVLRRILDHLYWRKAILFMILSAMINIMINRSLNRPQFKVVILFLFLTKLSQIIDIYSFVSYCQIRKHCGS